MHGVHVTLPWWLAAAAGQRRCPVLARSGRGALQGGSHSQTRPTLRSRTAHRPRDSSAGEWRSDRTSCWAHASGCFFSSANTASACVRAWWGAWVRAAATQHGPGAAQPARHPAAGSRRRRAAWAACPATPRTCDRCSFCELISIVHSCSKALASPATSALTSAIACCCFCGASGAIAGRVQIAAPVLGAAPAQSCCSAFKRLPHACLSIPPGCERRGGVRECKGRCERVRRRPPPR